MNVALVITTTGTRASLLDRAIKSALAQKYQFSEIMVVNDGAVPVENLPKDIRIVKTKTYEGLPAARKLGVSKLSRDVDAVCYLDDDDELLPEHVSSLLVPIESGAKFAFSRAVFRYPDMTETEDPEPSNKGHKRYYDPNALLEQNIAPVSSFMHTIQAYDEIGGWDKTLIRMEDWDFWARMYIRFGPPILVNKVTNVIYKQTAGNLTDSNPFSYSMACSWRDIVSDRLKYLRSHDSCRVTDELLTKFHIPRTGIILPVNQDSLWIDNFLSTLRIQSFKDWEVIITDYGSGGMPWGIQAHLSDPRIRIFLTPSSSKSLLDAQNFALLVSRSEYLAFKTPMSIPDHVEYLENHRDVMGVGKGSPVMIRRRAVEIAGGYDTDEAQFWTKISSRFKTVERL